MPRIGTLRYEKHDGDPPVAFTRSVQTPIRQGGRLSRNWRRRMSDEASLVRSFPIGRFPCGVAVAEQRRSRRRPAPYPGVDAGSDGQGDCPYVEKMRAYGECHWYHDEEYQDGNACEIVPDEPMAEETFYPEKRRCRDRVRHGTGDPVPDAQRRRGPHRLLVRRRNRCVLPLRVLFGRAAGSMTDEESSCDAESYAERTTPSRVHDGC